jgi:hypothetical protein
MPATYCAYTFLSGYVLLLDMENFVFYRLEKSKSYGWLKRKVKNVNNTIYKGSAIAPMWKVWQTDAGWFARLDKFVVKDHTALINQ